MESEVLKVSLRGQSLLLTFYVSEKEYSSNFNTDRCRITESITVDSVGVSNEQSKEYLRYITVSSMAITSATRTTQ